MSTFNRLKIIFCVRGTLSRLIEAEIICLVKIIFKQKVTWLKPKNKQVLVLLGLICSAFKNFDVIFVERLAFFEK